MELLIRFHRIGRLIRHLLATPLPPVLQRTFPWEAGAARPRRDAIRAKGRRESPAGKVSGSGVGSTGRGSRRRGLPAGCGRRGGGGEHLNNVGTGSRGKRGRRAREPNPGCPRRKAPNTADAGNSSCTVLLLPAFPARRSKTGCAEFPAPVLAAGPASAFRSETVGAFGEARVMVAVIVSEILPD